ncbi:Vesicle trafficking between the ER and Golgi [Neocucurbitaria cava]|uniref:Vesicle trafficking between the ER and Golgi n=1 Tax=Neocucurbitaria cava TaxID=798079 RepID=A0A9W8YBZ7_9PLEO|nr:Vesicle trafficking between the ER and Golgi [Neocucurbitaria cava]
MALTLRDKQIASIKRILNLNAPLPDAGENDEGNNVPTNAATDSAAWKILVFDDMGRDVISSVLRVNDLRASGVTIFLNINSMRNPINDVPVVYFVEPTEPNIKKITADLAQGLYTPAYINFTNSISRELLENFGAMTVASSTAEHIAQIYDQSLSFVVTEPDLFSLNMKKSYYTLNSAKTSDAELDHVVDSIVGGLFSVCVTMKALPIIRCPKGGAAEDISAKLDRKLRDHLLNSRTNVFSESSAVGSRPLLILVDRNIDLLPMLSHSWI